MWEMKIGGRWHSWQEEIRREKRKREVFRCVGNSPTQSDRMGYLQWVSGRKERVGGWSSSACFAVGEGPTIFFMTSLPPSITGPLIIKSKNCLHS
jgi:hypothetical protein